MFNILKYSLLFFLFIFSLTTFFWLDEILDRFQIHVLETWYKSQPIAHSLSKLLTLNYFLFQAS
jgi:hypothetical protein